MQYKIIYLLRVNKWDRMEWIECESLNYNPILHVPTCSLNDYQNVIDISLMETLH